MMPSHILDDALNNVIIRVNKSWKVVQKKKCLALSEHFILHFEADYPPWIMSPGL